MDQPKLNEEFICRALATAANDPHSVVSALAVAPYQDAYDRGNQFKSTRMKVAIQSALSSSQRLFLQDEIYPYLEVVFLNTSGSDHSLAYARRMVEQELVFKKCLNTEVVVDVGGNWAQNLRMGRINVHSCCPLLDARDAKRETERSLQYRKWADGVVVKHARAVDGKFRSKYESIQQFGKERNKFYCNKKAEDCDVKASMVVFNDSLYDISLQQLAKILDMKEVDMAFANITFSPEMLISDKGFIKGMNCYWEVKEKEVQKEILSGLKVHVKQKVIEYYFADDMSLNYEHDYLNLVRMATQQSLITPEGRTYVIERSYKHGLMNLTYTLAEGFSTPTQLSFRMWREDVKGRRMVRLYEYVGLGGKVVQQDIVVTQVSVEDSLYDAVLAYALRLKDDKFTPEAIFDYICSKNSRVTLNGVDITVKEGVSANTGHSLSFTIWFEAFMMRFSRSSVQQFFIDHELKTRKLRDLEWYNVLVYCLIDVAAPAVCTSMMNETLSMTKWFEKLRTKLVNKHRSLPDFELPGWKKLEPSVRFEELVEASEWEYSPMEYPFEEYQELVDYYKNEGNATNLRGILNGLAAKLRTTEPDSESYRQLKTVFSLVQRHHAKVAPEEKYDFDMPWDELESRERKLDMFCPLPGGRIGLVSESSTATSLRPSQSASRVEQSSDTSQKPTVKVFFKDCQAELVFRRNYQVGYSVLPCPGVNNLCAAEAVQKSLAHSGVNVAFDEVVSKLQVASNGEALNKFKLTHLISFCVSSSYGLLVLRMKDDVVYASFYGSVDGVLVTLIHSDDHWEAVVPGEEFRPELCFAEKTPIELQKSKNATAEGALSEEEDSNPSKQQEQQNETGPSRQKGRVSDQTVTGIAVEGVEESQEVVEYELENPDYERFAEFLLKDGVSIVPTSGAGAHCGAYAIAQGLRANGVNVSDEEMIRRLQEASGGERENWFELPDLFLDAQKYGYTLLTLDRSGPVAHVYITADEISTVTVMVSNRMLHWSTVVLPGPLKFVLKKASKSVDTPEVEESVELLRSLGVELDEIAGVSIPNRADSDSGTDLVGGHKSDYQPSEAATGSEEAWSEAHSRVELEYVCKSSAVKKFMQKAFHDHSESVVSLARSELPGKYYDLSVEETLVSTYGHSWASSDDAVVEYLDEYFCSLAIQCFVFFTSKKDITVVSCGRAKASRVEVVQVYDNQPIDFREVSWSFKGWEGGASRSAEGEVVFTEPGEEGKSRTPFTCRSEEEKAFVENELGSHSKHVTKLARRSVQQVCCDALLSQELVDMYGYAWSNNNSAVVSCIDKCYHNQGRRCVVFFVDEVCTSVAMCGHRDAKSVEVLQVSGDAFVDFSSTEWRFVGWEGGATQSDEGIKVKPLLQCVSQALGTFRTAERVSRTAGRLNVPRDDTQARVDRLVKSAKDYGGELKIVNRKTRSPRKQRFNVEMVIEQCSSNMSQERVEAATEKVYMGTAKDADEQVEVKAKPEESRANRTDTSAKNEPPEYEKMSKTDVTRVMENRMQLVQSYLEYLQQSVKNFASHCEYVWSQRACFGEEFFKTQFARHENVDNACVLTAAKPGVFKPPKMYLGNDKNQGLSFAYDPIASKLRSAKVQDNTLIVEGNPERVLIFKGMLEFLDFMTLNCVTGLQSVQSLEPRRKFRLIDGVPGCAKSTEIANSIGERDMAAVASRSACEDLQEKFRARGKNSAKARTIGSRILGRKETCDRLWVDEGLKVHPGELIILAEICCCKEVIVMGDSKQNLFEPRVPGYLMPDIPVHWSVEYRTESKTAAKDAVVFCARLKVGGTGPECDGKGYYPGGFTTISKRERTMYVQEIHSEGEVPKHPEAKYLTFTQSDKEKLVKRGFNANTVNEFQGGRSKHIVLVRLQRNMDVNLRDSSSQAIVAVTRHTERLDYFTVEQPTGLQDLVYRGIKRLTAIDNLNAAYESMDGDLTSRVREVKISESYNLQGGSPQGLRAADPLLSIVTVLTDIIPGSTTVDTRFDPAMIEHSDLRITADGHLRIPTINVPTVLRPRITLEPKVPTTTSPPRQTTFKQCLLALIKRNMGGAYVGSMMDYKSFANSALEKMLDVFAVPDWRAKQAEWDSIVPDLQLLAEWESVQNPTTLSAMEKMDTSFAFDDVVSKIDDYEFILKQLPKAATDAKPLAIYPTVQTVMFHKKSVNCFYGPLVRKADERFRSILLDSTLYNKGKNLDDIEQFLGEHFDASPAVRTVENDFSDFDRGQKEVAHCLDEALLRFLKLRHEDVDLWMKGHNVHTNYNYGLGLKVTLLYQRKSGDVTTAFGNTVLNMTALAFGLDLKPGEVNAAMFLGDDSWLQIREGPYLTDRVRACSERIAVHFNGEAKTAMFKHGYFCGNYILNTGAGLKIAADPVKRGVKLGRWDVKNVSLLNENWISFADLMRNYDNEEVQELLALAVVERTPRATYGSTKLLIESLNSIRASYKEFRNLFSEVPSETHY